MTARVTTRPLIPLLMAAASVVVALAALMQSAALPMRPSDEAAGVIRLPEPLGTAIIALFALAALMVLSLLVPRGVRRRRKDDEEFEFVHEQPKPSPWLLVVLGLILAAPVALVGYVVWSGWTPFADIGAGLGHDTPHAITAPSRLFPGPPTPVPAAPLFSWSFGLLTIAGGLAACGLALWVLVGDRLAWW